MVAVIILQIDQDVPIRVTIQTQVTSSIVSHEQVIRYAGYTYQENGEPSNIYGKCACHRFFLRWSVARGYPPKKFR